MGRLLGIDYGKTRIGLAISDPLNMFATGLDTLHNTSAKKVLAALNQLVQEKDIDAIIIGLPKRTDGKPSEMEAIVRTFGDKLHALTKLPIHYEDERFTSTIAQQAMKEAGLKPSQNKGMVDQTAAVLILQQYMEKQRL